MFPFTEEVEVIPLLDYDHALESAKQTLASIRAMKK